MTVILEEDLRMENLRQVAKLMLAAARTAPKGRGEDNTVLAMVEQPEIQRISNRMKEMVARLGLSGAFPRDAENILKAPVILLLGTRIKPMRLAKCGMCGFANCDAKNEHPNIPCVFNTGDLGIAIGSAVSIATEHRIDNRIMYTVGQAVLEMELLGPEVKIAYAIPLSISSKNPFFDRG
jgi:uncharacterized ferredoxin-like protein